MGIEVIDESILLKYQGQNVEDVTMNLSYLNGEIAEGRHIIVETSLMETTEDMNELLVQAKFEMATMSFEHSQQLNTCSQYLKNILLNKNKLHKPLRQLTASDVT